MKILCLCQRGNVRSATAAVILRDFFGLSDVIASGVQTTTPETMAFLAEWADYILVCGDEILLTYPFPELRSKKMRFIEVGADIWGKPMHPDLVAKLVHVLDEVLRLPHAGYYSDPQTYIQANAAAQAR